MDKRKNNNDWTDAVRQRLEGRELTPGDALWERIDAAAAAGQAPHKVRPLAWAGALGAAAAAVLAAVLLLRPAGAPEPGRIDVLPSPSSSLAEVQEPDLRADDVLPEAVVSKTPASAPSRPLLSHMAADSRPTAADVTHIHETESEPYVTIADNPADKKEDAAPITAAPANAAPVSEPAEKPSGAIQSPSGNTTEPSMTMDDYLRLEAAAQRRHRRLGAALYASGLPYNNLQGNDDLIGFDDIETSYNDPGGSPLEPVDPHTGNSFGSGTGSQSNPGYTSNPESPKGFEPVKYNDDPYNINGDRLNHSKPLNVGLAVSLPLSPHLFVESGLYWSYLRSSSYRITNQSLHFIGVPLKLGYRFAGPGRTSFALSAGAKAEKCVSATRTYLPGNTSSFQEPGLQFAAVGSAAVQYDFTPRLGIFLAPELSYWFTKTELPTYNTENPFNLSLKAGLNLTLGR